MNKNKLAFILLSALLASQSVSAAVITRNNEGNISISGELGEKYAGTEIQIQILGPFDKNTEFKDAVFSGLENGQFFVPDTYANTVVSDEAGRYSFVYKISEENKFYTAAVLEPGADVPQTAGIYAAASELLNKFIKDINAAGTSAAISEILKKEEYKNLLEGNRSGFSSISDSEALEKISKGIKDGTPYNNFTGFENELSTLCAVQLINLSKSGEDARKIAEERLDISKAELWDYYNVYVEEEKNNVFARMLGHGFDNREDFMEILDESIFLERVAKESYAANMTELITLNEKRFGFDLDGYEKNSLSVNKKLYGQDFKTMSDFKKALSEAIDAAGNSSSGGGGGNSSSGGGGSHSSSKPGSDPIIVDIGNPTKTDVPEETGYFDDLTEVSWAEEAINALAEKKIIAGKEERKFYPRDNVLREEFVKMAVGAFDIAKGSNSLSFEDVSKDAWYYESICSAYEAGIVSGQDENYFGVGAQISRQDMAVILYRAAVSEGVEFDSQSEKFADDGSISDYAKDAVYALKNKGVVSGVGENRFEPGKNASRAEAAKMIYEIMKLVNLK